MHLTPSIILAQEEYHFSTNWTSSYINNWLNVLSEIKGKENLNYLEIGVWEGRSIIWIFENILTHSTSRATAIDIELVPSLLHNLKLAKINQKINLIESSSEIALAKFKPETFDVIYLDACHLAKNVYLDAALSWGILKPGGILIFDDYKFYDNGKLPLALRPKISIDAFLTAFANDLTILHKGYQVVVKKNKTPLNEICPERCNQCSRFFEYVYSWSLFNKVYKNGCLEKGLYSHNLKDNKLVRKHISEEEENYIRDALLMNKTLSSASDKDAILNQYPKLKFILQR